MSFFRSVIATVTAGFAVLSAAAACGPSGATCSADFHTVLDSAGNASATCPSNEACASTGTSSACVKCDPTQCRQGNDCISGWAFYADYLKGDKSNQTTECRLKCSAPTDCPFNFHCVPSDSGQGYCAKDRAPGFLGGDYKPAQPGAAAAAAPWGVACQPGDGFDNNKACDTAQSFWCYGTSPTDANAYCTQYQCGDDADCPGGWWCATINDSPNVAAAKRGDWGKAGVTSLCMPRAYNLKPGSYCAPCKTDLDCPTNDSTPQHCVSADANGGAELVCAAECTDDHNCPLDYTCQDPGSGTPVCVPRAATCITKPADAQFCTPCHSDADCDAINGYCVMADYSTEHYCTTKSGVACSVSNNTLTAQCPKTTGTPTNAGVSCAYNGIDFAFPKDQCFGLVNFGTGTNAAQVGGCWTKH
jgi:hypothetical protein